MTIEPGYYRHFKGNWYKVFFTGTHSETEEAVVVYQDIKTKKHYVRPLSMFFDQVPPGKFGQTQRFVKVDPIPVQRTVPPGTSSKEGVLVNEDGTTIYDDHWMFDEEELENG